MPGPVSYPPSTVFALLGNSYKWMAKLLQILSAFSSSSFFITGLTVTNNSPVFGTSISWSNCTVWYQGLQYSIAAGNTTDPLVWWVPFNTTFSHGTAAPAGTVTPGFVVMTNINGLADVIWNRIGRASVTPSNISQEMPIVVGAVWTDNSPGAGQVAWNAHTIVYKGVQYAIGAGNTPVGVTGRNIIWAIGGASYSTAALYAGGSNEFLIAVNENNSGSHDTAWNKVPTEGLNGIHMANNLTAFQWDDGAGDTLTIFASAPAATATAGAAALPANPVGFLVVTINGTSRKIPFYAT